ncbi:hypothetical protein ACFY8N_13905 [Streptomyces collinus]|uniref:hypothetical protein n=1 Tax=Streptomyces collinus TaxID=42684 RepID=UPI0036C4974E
MPEDLTDDDIRQWVNLAGRVKEKATDTALAGPKKVTESALVLEHASEVLVRKMAMFQQVTSEDVSVSENVKTQIRRDFLAAGRDLDRCLRSFVLTAQAALDDDGSRQG